MTYWRNAAGRISQDSDALFSLHHPHFLAPDRKQGCQLAVIDRMVAAGQDQDRRCPVNHKAEALDNLPRFTADALCRQLRGGCGTVKFDDLDIELELLKRLLNIHEAHRLHGNIPFR